MTTRDQRQALQNEGIALVHAASVTIQNGNVVFLEDAEEWYRDPVKVLNALQEIRAAAPKAMFEAVRYQGFDKAEFLKAWTVKHGFSMSTMVKVAFIGAIRGTNIEKLRDLFSSPVLAIPDVATLLTALSAGALSIKTPATRMSPEGRQAVTIARCLSVVPHIVCAMMKLAEVPARYSDLPLPGYLQFPAAASLPLSAGRRAEHIFFNNRFSAAISAGRADVGTRQMTIYNQQAATGILPLKMPAWIARLIKDDITIEAHDTAIAGNAELADLVDATAEADDEQ
jgi:hypothetical protein